MNKFRCEYCGKTSPVEQGECGHCGANLPEAETKTDNDYFITGGISLHSPFSEWNLPEPRYSGSIQEVEEIDKNEVEKTLQNQESDTPPWILLTSGIVTAAILYGLFKLFDFLILIGV